jgi:cadmium resistance protein CadD (predicted permease)
MKSVTAKRLGHVLNWAGWILASLLWAYGISLYLQRADLGLALFTMALGLIPLGIGMACRYVLSGD